MVEHASAQTADQTSRCEQSLDGSRTKRKHLLRQQQQHPGASITTTTVRVPVASRFSLFRWFSRRHDSNASADSSTTTTTTGNSLKNNNKNNKKRRYLFRRVRRRTSSTSSSSSSSSDTFYSTATVRSFAFQRGRLHQQQQQQQRKHAELEDALLRLNQSPTGAVGPFAPGAAKLVEQSCCRHSVISTLPSGFTQRRDIEARYSLLPSSFLSYDSIPIAERKPRIFAEVRAGNNNLNHNNNTNVDNKDVVTLLVNGNDKKIHVHVKGKRRAPEPPINHQPQQQQQQQRTVHAANGIHRRKRRPAPQPPGTLSSNQDTLSSEASMTGGGMDVCSSLTRNGIGDRQQQQQQQSQSISNDTLVLRRGVLLAKKKNNNDRIESRTPTPSICESDGTNTPSLEVVSVIMPRPWYKRNNNNNSSSVEHSPINCRTNGRRGDVLRGQQQHRHTPISCNSADESSLDGSLSRVGFFRRDGGKDSSSNNNSKRKSGVSILMNISELDREAAAIVEREQARNRASMLIQAAKMDEEFERRMGVNEEIVQEIVNSSISGNSPRRSARALISKFNALGSIANGSFFKNSGGGGSGSPKTKAKRFGRANSNNDNDDFDKDRVLARYFGLHDKEKSSSASPKRESAAIFTEVIKSVPRKINATTTTSTTTTTNIPVTKEQSTASKPKTTQVNDEKEDIELIKSLATELDDVASGIARLRRELDKRPKMIEAIDKIDGDAEIDDLRRNNKQTNGNKQDKELDKEFTRIFGEIDKQLKAKDSKVEDANAIKINNSNVSSVKNNSNGNSITDQVAKVIDILVNVEKEAKSNQQPVTMRNPSSDNRGARTSVVRLSGVDDKETAQLKEMLKEMKHSLPKRPRPELKTDDLSTTMRPILAPKVTSNSTKVSSGVQTSGNVRKVDIAISSVPSSGSETKQQQQQQRGEYVELEPVSAAVEVDRRRKRNEALPENTYVNVMEKSLYANAQVAPPRQPSSSKVIVGGVEVEEENDESRFARARPKIDLRGLPGDKEAAAAAGSRKNDKVEDDDKLEDIKKQYMNTLAVNRLLKRLEAAIASGNHQQAANLAKELAQLKIQCSVVRQRRSSSASPSPPTTNAEAAPRKEMRNLRLYIEDKQAHQGPIPLQLPLDVTVAQLKAKIQIEFEIPANVQRWIIGKNLADNDESTLEELQAVEGSPVFLYLVAPQPLPPADSQDKGAIKADKQPREAAVAEEVVVAVARQAVINEKNDEQIYEIKGEIEPAPVEPGLEDQEPQAARKINGEKEDELARDEKLKRYEELMSLENCDVISNAEPIECPVCFMIFAPGEGVILRDCLHSFCRECVANVVRYCEEAEVKCPYRDADYTCDSTLQEREIKALVSADVYQQHLAKSIAQAENNAGNNAFHCKTPDCPGWCIYDDNVNNFLCPVCKVNNCLTCQAIHMGKNCRQYQEELKNSKETDVESKRTAAMLEDMVDRGEALPCPTCAVVLMKKWGCDWLRCSMCKTEICWVTRGPRWGPAGKGDISGGCRCGENGVKCHPRCNYCH